jgi:hypothetical protein
MASIPPPGALDARCPCRRMALLRAWPQDLGGRARSGGRQRPGLAARLSGYSNKVSVNTET